LSPLETARGCLSVTQPPPRFLQLHPLCSSTIFLLLPLLLKTLSLFGN
jgi:hypothetical protein